MALDIRIGIINEKNKIIIADQTGDYNAVTNPGGWIPATARSFTGVVNTTNDTLTYNAHGFYTGQVLTYTFAGSPMASVASGDELYANVIDANTLKFALYPTNPGLIPVLDLNNATLTSNALTPYNDVRARVTAISLAVTLPGSTTALTAINLYTTNFWVSPDYALDLTSSVTLQEGVWKFVVTFTIDGVVYTNTKYALRVNEMKCSIAELALGDMSINGYEDFKILYDRMVQAFECGEYVLAQDIYVELNDMFTDCSPYAINSCGC
jgi:hypothetical protein